MQYSQSGYYSHTPMHLRQHRMGEQYIPPPLPQSYHRHANITARSWHDESNRRGDGVQLDKELADLLLSWYYSGYQAGRYQAMRELQEHHYHYS